MTETTVEKCPCGHRGCDQYTLSTQRSVGFDLETATLYAAAEDMKAAMEKFVARVEAGEVRSKRTYAEFKAILAKARPA